MLRVKDRLLPGRDAPSAGIPQLLARLVAGGYEWSPDCDQLPAEADGTTTTATAEDEIGADPEADDHFGFGLDLDEAA